MREGSGFKGGRDEIKSAALQDLNIGADIRQAGDHDDIYRNGGPLGQPHDVRPRAIGKLCTRKYQFGRLRACEPKSRFRTRLGMLRPHRLAAQSLIQGLQGSIVFVHKQKGHGNCLRRPGAHSGQ